MTEFQNLLIQLDQQLTEKEFKFCQKTFLDHSKSLSHEMTELDFLEGDLYYLSDGGYSRLFFDFNQGLKLVDHTEKTQNNWQDCQNIINQLNKIIINKGIEIGEL